MGSYAIMPLVWGELNAHRGHLRGRTSQLGNAWVFQWSQLPQDASASAREAGSVASAAAQAA